MCQSRAQGGRRCPSHRRDTRLLMDILQRDSDRYGYGYEFFHDLFVDLRRTYRGVEMTKRQRRGAEKSMTEFLECTGRVLHEKDVDPADTATLQAQMQLSEIEDLIPDAVEEQLNAGLGVLSQKEARATFGYVYANLSEFDQPSEQELEKARIVLGDTVISRLPTAVQALAVIRAGAIHRPREKIPAELLRSRVVYTEDTYSNLGSLLRVGYAPATEEQPSRLEIVWSDPDVPPLSYKNVSLETFQSLVDDGDQDVRLTLRDLRANPKVQYASREESEADAFVAEGVTPPNRCEYCGQYTGTAVHACPTIAIDRSVSRKVSDFMYGTRSEYPTIFSHTDENGEAIIPQVLPRPEMPAFVQPEPNAPVLDLEGLRELSGTTLLTDQFKDKKVHISKIDALYSLALEEFVSTGSIPAGYSREDTVVFTDDPESGALELLAYLPLSENIIAFKTEEGIFLQHAGDTEVPWRWDDVYPYISTRSATYFTENFEEQAPIHSSALSVYEQTTMFNPDAAPVNDETRDKWLFPLLSEVNESLNLHSVVAVNFAHEVTIDANGRFLDSTGASYEPSPTMHIYDGLSQRRVSATLIIERSADGAVRLLGHDFSSCSTCRTTTCSHQKYTFKQFAKVLTESLATVEDDNNDESGVPGHLRLNANITVDSEGNNHVEFKALNHVTTYPRLYGRLDSRDASPEDAYYYRSRASAPHSSSITTALQVAGAEGSVVVPVMNRFEHLRSVPLESADRRTQQATVEGSITFANDEEGNPFVRERTLKCNCDVYQRNYTCRHTRQVESNALGLIEPTPEQAPPREPEEARDAVPALAVIRLQDRKEALQEPIPDEESARVILEAERRLSFSERDALAERYESVILAEEREAARLAELQEMAAYSAQREKMATRYEAFEGPRYSEDYAAFDAELKEVKKKIAEGEDPLTYETTNVLNGIGDDTEHARKFGIELEVVFDSGLVDEDSGPGWDDDDDYRNDDDDYYEPESAYFESKNKVAQDLAEAGLANSAEVESYHSGQASGWDKWTAEEDCTVDLEVVSPIMSDTPEGWSQLQRVCDIIKARGGTVNRATGSHVHISTGDYGKSVAAHAALLDEFSRYSDILYRLGSNPNTKTHRGTQWCRPNTITPGEVMNRQEQGGYQSISSYLEAPHSSAVNFEASGEGKTSHAEVRLWDGSLEPRVIQMQVMLTAAMTEVAAQRVSNEEADEFTYSSDLMPLGSSKETKFSSKKEETAKFREMLDRYFPREADRKRFVALWAMTKWQSEG